MGPRPRGTRLGASAGEEVKVGVAEVLRYPAQREAAGVHPQVARAEDVPDDPAVDDSANRIVVVLFVAEDDRIEAAGLEFLNAFSALLSLSLIHI